MNRVLLGIVGHKPTPGYSMDLDKTVLQRGNEIEAKVTLDSPPPDALLQQIVTNPYVIAIVERGSFKKVRFVNE